MSPNNWFCFWHLLDSETADTAFWSILLLRNFNNCFFFSVSTFARRVALLASGLEWSLSSRVFILETKVSFSFRSFVMSVISSFSCLRFDIVWSIDCSQLILEKLQNPQRKPLFSISSALNSGIHTEDQIPHLLEHSTLRWVPWLFSFFRHNLHSLIFTDFQMSIYETATRLTKTPEQGSLFPTSKTGMILYTQQLKRITEVLPNSNLYIWDLNTVDDQNNYHVRF